MRPQLYKLPIAPDTSFLYIDEECNYFDKPWHFHKEYELVYITKTKGTRFIGDQVSFFEDGDLVLLGPNIPHLYRNSDDYYKKNNELTAKSICIHFTEYFLGNSFFDLPEMKQVKKLLERSSLGLEVTQKSNVYVKNKLVEMLEQKPANRLMNLLEILVFLSTSKEVSPILSKTFTASNDNDTDRIDKVIQFILNNYKNDIYIEEIASKLNMSISSFSRYFKHHTHKTFSNYVTEIRISHACRLMMDSHYNISEICYMSGFENQSNFYRHFKKFTGIIPKEYKARFLNNTTDIEV